MPEGWGVKTTMPFCPACGEQTAAEDEFCAVCGKSLAKAKQRRGTNRPVDAQPKAPRDEDYEDDFEDVPGWLGWVALPVYMFTTLFGLVIYSSMAWNKGRIDGRDFSPTAAPYEGFKSHVVLLLFLSFIPIVGIWAVVRLPTLCYKQGLRVGAEGAEPLDDPGLIFDIVIFSFIAVVVIAFIVFAASV